MLAADRDAAARGALSCEFTKDAAKAAEERARRRSPALKMYEERRRPARDAAAAACAAPVSVGGNMIFALADDSVIGDVDLEELSGDQSARARRARQAPCPTGCAADAEHNARFWDGSEGASGVVRRRHVRPLEATRRVICARGVGAQWREEGGRAAPSRSP